MKKFLLALLSIVISFPVFAQGYIVIGSSAKVYDQPNAKGYATTNRLDQDVVLQPGMCFQSEGNNAGWLKIQYSPGIRGYIMDSALDKSATLPAPGSYKVANTDEKADLALNGANWTLTVGNKKIDGTVSGAVVVFINQFGNPAYIATKSGGKTYIFNYDNQITNFI